MKPATLEDIPRIAEVPQPQKAVEPKAKPEIQARISINPNEETIKHLNRWAKEDRRTTALFTTMLIERVVEQRVVEEKAAKEIRGAGLAGSGSLLSQMESYKQSE